AGVENLDDHLDVGGGEEPQIPRVAGQRYRLRLTGAAGAGVEGRRDLEPALVQAEIGRFRRATGAGLEVSVIEVRGRGGAAARGRRHHQEDRGRLRAGWRDLARCRDADEDVVVRLDERGACLG